MPRAEKGFGELHTGASRADYKLQFKPRRGWHAQFPLFLIRVAPDDGPEGCDQFRSPLICTQTLLETPKSGRSGL
jgi:hypothetical protein